RSDINIICESLGYAPEELPLPTSVKQKISSDDDGNNNRAKKTSGRRGKRSGGGRQNKRSKSTKPKRGKSSQNLKELPRPTFDQLEGGRTGKKKKKGLFGFIKKLFD
ncbi:MAG: hypothetical protein EA391_04640, partial [Balneolaceae bacterium]